MPGEFADIAVNSKGDMMAVNTLSHIYLYFRSGHFDAPEDLKTLLKNNFVEITLWDVPITTDYDGNFLTFASPDFDTKFLVVFNPEGVKGTNGGGHIYRNTLK